MASKIPVVYRKSSDKVVSIGVYDALENASIQTFYPFIEKTSGSTTYKLGTQTVYSDDILLSGSWSAVPGNVLSGSFDVAFNQPQTIKGLVSYNIPVSVFSGGSPGANVFVILQKVHNGTATTMGNAESEEYNATNASGIINMSTDVSKTKFEAGDTLRLQIIANAYGGTGTINIGVDPQNRSSGAKMAVGTTIDTTTTSLKIPFLVDI